MCGRSADSKADVSVRLGWQTGEIQGCTKVASGITGRCTFQSRAHSPLKGFIAQSLGHNWCTHRSKSPCRKTRRNRGQYRPPSRRMYGLRRLTWCDGKCGTAVSLFTLCRVTEISTVKAVDMLAVIFSDPRRRCWSPYKHAAKS